MIFLCFFGWRSCWGASSSPAIFFGVSCVIDGLSDPCVMYSKESKNTGAGGLVVGSSPAGHNGYLHWIPTFTKEVSQMMRASEHHHGAPHILLLNNMRHPPTSCRARLGGVAAVLFYYLCCWTTLFATTTSTTDCLLPP